MARRLPRRVVVVRPGARRNCIPSGPLRGGRPPNSPVDYYPLQPYPRRIERAYCGFVLLWLSGSARACAGGRLLVAGANPPRRDARRETTSRRPHTGQTCAFSCIRAPQYGQVRIAWSSLVWVFVAEAIQPSPNTRRLAEFSGLSHRVRRRVPLTTVAREVEHTFGPCQPA